MKAIVCVKGCSRDAQNGTYQALLNTWFPHVEGRLFCGRSSHSLNGYEVRLDCPDDYLSLPLKTKAICEWLLNSEYEFGFLCDTDTYIVPWRLLTSDFEKFSITAWWNGPIGKPYVNCGTNYAWVSGGNGYWLSKKAAEIILTTPHGEETAEDKMVGVVLGSHIETGNITAQHRPDYGSGATFHYCSEGMKRPFDLNWLYSLHRRWM